MFLRISIVVAAVWAFYWYEYRPSEIRSTCEGISTEQAVEQFENFRGKDKKIEGLYSRSTKEAFYLNCLNHYGLKE